MFWSDKSRMIKELDRETEKGKKKESNQQKCSRYTEAKEQINENETPQF